MLAICRIVTGHAAFLRENNQRLLAFLKFSQVAKNEMAFYLSCRWKTCFTFFEYTLETLECCNFVDIQNKILAHILAPVLYFCHGKQFKGKKYMEDGSCLSLSVLVGV